MNSEKCHKRPHVRTQPIKQFEQICFIFHLVIALEPITSMRIHLYILH